MSSLLLFAGFISLLMVPTLCEQARRGDGILSIAGTFVGAWAVMIAVGALVYGFFSFGIIGVILAYAILAWLLI